MKTLVIHPLDSSTTMLNPIWEKKGYDVLQGGDFDVSMLEGYDRYIMMGHGSPGGLFSVGQFHTKIQSRFKNIPGIPFTFDSGYVISDEAAPYLKNKDNIYIWCHARTFVEEHGLHGFTTGMFISEVSEAAWYRIKATQEEVDYQNDLFAKLVAENEMNGSEAVWKAVMAEYTHPTCPIIAYNRSVMNHLPLA